MMGGEGNVKSLSPRIWKMFIRWGRDGRDGSRRERCKYE